MCTVSFIARRNGYALAMNRDEKLARQGGLPPAIRSINGRQVICPSEPGGGTWIALNDAGVTLALINWYSITGRIKQNPVSRGEVVTGAAPLNTRQSVSAALAMMPLQKTNPFRLVGIFPQTREIIEWRWNLKTLVQKRHPWKARQWISSGFDEPKAQTVRSATFRQAQHLRATGTIAWMRRLHRSHSPDAGPFSTCMHRADAATVSYTEISLCGCKATMRHCGEPPCLASHYSSHQLRLIK